MLGVVLAGMLMWSSVAGAALVRPFLGTVAKSKKGFSEEVCGVSVDPASGEIFVSDPEAEDVQVFDGSGTFLSGRTISSVQVPEAETKEEVEAREEKEKKEIEKGKTPKEVAGKFEKEELEEFCSTAVNDKNGDLYIADGGEAAIYPFDKEGKQVFHTNNEGKRIAGAEITGKETPAGEFTEELSIAIDQSSGRLYVSDREHEAVDYFSEAGKYEGQLAFPGSPEDEHLTGPVAVDQATGEVYVAVQGQAFDEAEREGFAFVYVFDSSGKFLREISGHRSGEFAGFGAETEPLITGLAVGPEGNLYVSDAARRVVFEFDHSGAFVGQIAGTPSGNFTEPVSVALNKAGDLYVVDRTDEHNGERTVLGLSPLPGALDEFGPATVSGAPTVESESSSEITASGATLRAGIDPTGVETRYYFEVCQGASCQDVPAAPGTDVGSGEATQQVSQQVAGLAANTIYSFRVVLSYGPESASTVFGATQTFTTGTEGASVQLPDGRAWELVSSPEKGGAGLEAIPREGGLIESSESGDALTYISLAPDEASPEGNRVPTFAQLLAKRQGGGASASWSSKDITLPGERASGAVTGEGKQEYRAFTPDLALSLVEPLGLGTTPEPHLSTDGEGNLTDTERTIYTRKTEDCEPAPSVCYTPLVTASNVVEGTKFGGQEGTKKGIQFVNATPDLSHVVFKSEVPLTNSPSEPAFPGSSNLYEWSAGALHLINVLPKPTETEQVRPTPEPEPRLGTEFLTRHAISDDGSLVVFRTSVIDQNEVEHKHLYVRDMVSGETLQVDAGAQEGEPIFQDASSNGSKIFFTDEAKLTALSSASSGGHTTRDLYEFNVETHVITDLSVQPNFKQNGEHAAVQGLVPGISEDGSTVYFVANGVLTSTPNANGESAQPGHCVKRLVQEEAVADATCNLYVKQGDDEAEPPKFIGRLSEDDVPDWEYENGGNLENVTDRVTASGQYFAFMSDRARWLTGHGNQPNGYDNRDTNPAAHEAPDEEVFLFDDSTGSLVCASCDPQGARPKGVFDAGSLVQGEEGIGLLTDRVENWEGKWLAGNLPGWTGTEGQTAIYQSRYLSESGRLFFNSPEALAQADTNGKADVYEYEPDGVGGCGSEGGCTGLISSGSSTHESAFLDASANGDDVFFLTSSVLSPLDRDKDLDVYDARVCGAAGCIVPPVPSSTSCSSAEGCRGGALPIPAYAPPASSTTPSSGNLSGQTGVLPSKTTQKPAVKKLTRAQQLAKALKSCKKLHKKKKRLACEKTARKRFGAKKHAAPKKGKR